MDIWELRFCDGRGASFYTDVDVTDGIGKQGSIRTISVADVVFEGTALRDAVECLKKGRVVALTAHLGAIAFAVRHEL